MKSAEFRVGTLTLCLARTTISAAQQRGDKVDDKKTAAYVPWGTFKNALDRLASIGLPGRIDRSVFGGLAGGTQTQLIAAMRFLGLIDEDHSPSKILREVTSKNESDRKLLLRHIFKSAYADLFQLDLRTASLDQVQEVLARAYGVTGSTLSKAVRFFLAGAKDLDIELSPFLDETKKKNGAPRSNGLGRRRAKKILARNPPPPQKPPGTSRTVPLMSGGTLTISADLDLFSLSAEDRAFVFKLIDDLERYEKRVASGDEAGRATTAHSAEEKVDS